MEWIRLFKYTIEHSTLAPGVRTAEEDNKHTKSVSYSSAIECNIKRLQLLDLYSKATLMTDLLPNAVRPLVDCAEDMSVLFVLPFLPDSLARTSPELAKALLELLRLLLFLLGNPAFKLGVERVRGSPFLPCELLNLIAQEQHHVAVCCLVRIGFQQVWHKVCVSELRWFTQAVNITFDI